MRTCSQKESPVSVANMASGNVENEENDSYINTYGFPNTVIKMLKKKSSEFSVVILHKNEMF